MPNDQPLDVRVREDHVRARERFAEFHASRNSHRARAFAELHRFLLAHEVAAQVVVRPAVASAAGGGTDEPIEASQLAPRLTQLERLGTEDYRFDSLFAELEAAFDAHAADEEERLRALRAELDDGELGKLGRRYARARHQDGVRHRRAHGADAAARADAAAAHDAFATATKRGAN